MPIPPCYSPTASRDSRPPFDQEVPPIPILAAAGAALSSPVSATAAQGFQGDVAGLILHSGPMAQLVLLVLAFFSVMSWAVMAERYRALSRAEREDLALLRRFRGTESLADLRDACERLPYSPMAHVYRTGFRELMHSRPGRGPGAPGGAATMAAPHESQMTARVLERAMISASSESLSRLERFLGFLASTASATPFIGLFGTVWGIMGAFRSIGMTGTANLATVAPGISEALITTAAGLAAAIPAVLGYNYFNNRLRVIGNRLDNFIAETMNRFEKAS
ncbi:MAG TPA: MotA/TolQ/ExbB proton channel family protein [Candidatus Polarisedimenticolia bacterium]|nr:MotA/TolQ/ExbB proton channel family protein [Candidatus Polarisedimenticolia bacterium]